MTCFTGAVKNCSNLSESEITFADRGLTFVVDNLSTYYIPSLVLEGIVGNALILFVFYKTKQYHNSGTSYLAALAVSDACFLVTLFITWLDLMGITTVYSGSISCKLFVYFTYVFCNLSAWLIVAYSLERAVAIIYPLHCEWLCTPAKARLYVLALVCMTLAAYVPLCYFAIAKPQCGLDMRYLEFASLFNFFDTFVSFTLPFTLVLLCNFCVVLSVRKMQKKQSIRSTGRDDIQYRVTRLMIIVSTTYLVLNSPNYVLRLYAYHYRDDVFKRNPAMTKLQYIATMCFNTTFGMNFVLLCLTGKNFRKNLVKCMPWLGSLKRCCTWRRKVQKPIPLLPMHAPLSQTNDKTTRPPKRLAAETTRTTADSKPGVSTIYTPPEMSETGQKKRWSLPFSGSHATKASQVPLTKPMEHRRLAFHNEERNVSNPNSSGNDDTNQQRIEYERYNALFHHNSSLPYIPYLEWDAYYTFLLSKVTRLSIEEERTSDNSDQKELMQLKLKRTGRNKSNSKRQLHQLKMRNKRLGVTKANAIKPKTTRISIKKDKTPVNFHFQPAPQYEPIAGPSHLHSNELSYQSEMVIVQADVHARANEASVCLLDETRGVQSNPKQGSDESIEDGTIDVYHIDSEEEDVFKDF